MCHILTILLHHTSSDYHLELTKSLFSLTEALYNELKKGGQEPFKKKVLFKLNYCIGLIVL
jgi:hypothetical protein